MALISEDRFIGLWEGLPPDLRLSGELTRPPMVAYCATLSQLPSRPRKRVTGYELSAKGLSLSAIRAKSGSEEAFIFRMT
jgi:hypothetical protein